MNTNSYRSNYAGRSWRLGLCVREHMSHVAALGFAELAGRIEMGSGSHPP